MTINIDSFRRHMSRLGEWKISENEGFVFAESTGRLVALDTVNNCMEVFIEDTGIMKTYDPELIASEIVDLIEEVLWDIEGIRSERS